MEGKNLVNVINVVIPLYFAILLGYLSVKPWKIFTHEQAKSLNTLNAVFVLPAFSFQFLAKTAIYDMNLIFVLADTVAKFGMLVGIGLWVQYLTAIPTVSEKWEWFVVSFMVASVATTLIIGIPLLDAMYGSESATLLAQIVVVQLVLWFPVLQILSQLNTSMRSAEALKDLEDHSVAGSVASRGVADASVVGGTTCGQDTGVQVGGSNLRGDAVEQLGQKSAKEKCISGEGVDVPNYYLRVEEAGEFPKGERDAKRVASMTMQIGTKIASCVNKLRGALHHLSGGKWTSKESYLKAASKFVTDPTQPIQALGPNGGPSPAADASGPTQVDLRMVMAPGTSDTSGLAANTSEVKGGRQGSKASKPGLGEGTHTQRIQALGPNRGSSPAAVASGPSHVDLRMVMAPGTCDTSGLVANSSEVRWVGQGKQASNPGLGEGYHPLETQYHGDLVPAVGESTVNVESSSTSVQGSTGMAPAQAPAASAAGPFEPQSRSEPDLDLRLKACQLARSANTATEAAISHHVRSAATFYGSHPAGTAPTLLQLATCGKVPACNLAGPSNSQDHQLTDGTKCIQLDMPSTGVPTGHARTHVITINPSSDNIYSVLAPNLLYTSAVGASASTTTSMEESFPTAAKSSRQAKDGRSCSCEEKASNLPQVASRRSEEKHEVEENGGGAVASAEERGQLSTMPGGADEGILEEHRQEISHQAGKQSPPSDFTSGLMPIFRSSSSGAGGRGGQVLTGEKEEKDFVTKSANHPDLTHQQLSAPSIPISLMPARGVESGPVIEHPYQSQLGLATTPQRVKSQLIKAGQEHLNTAAAVGTMVISSTNPTAEHFAPIPSPIPRPALMVPVPLHVPGTFNTVPIQEAGRKKGRRPSRKMSRAEIKQAVKDGINSFLQSQLVWASILGLTYSLLAGKLGFKMPTIMDKSLTLMANLCLGLSMFSLGLFMALQPKLIPISVWTTTWTFSLRLFWGPLVVSIVTYLFGCRGLLLKVAFIQNALPQAVITFVLANQFHMRADILSTGVCFGTLVSLPLLIVYYIILETFV